MDMLCFYNYESINDETLKRITLSIVDSCKTVTGNMFKIAALLARVEKDDLLMNEDFVNVIEYAKKCFGFEKTTAYNLLKIGHDFIKETEDGNVETVLTYLNNDYNVSQIIKMLPLGIDKAKELTHDGVITSDMSCRQIERIVKQNLKRMQPEDDPEEVDEEIEDDPEEVDEEIEDEKMDVSRHIIVLKSIVNKSRLNVGWVEIDDEAENVLRDCIDILETLAYHNVFKKE